MTVQTAKFEDMALAADIMVTSFRSAFRDFISPETMDACTNPDNCRKMLENIYREGKMHFLMGGKQGFICWQETENGAEIVAIHTLPESWGTGLGRAMLREVLRQIGDRPVYLWAFKDNTRARQFYEKHGSAGWELDTILQETGNCHLYEKMGYRRTAQCTVINDKMTLVGYEKD